jgi:hypothetical protein
VLGEINKGEKERPRYNHIKDDTCVNSYKQPWTDPQENEITAVINKHANRRSKFTL